MATRQLDALRSVWNHEVGNLNSISIKTLAHGALVEGNIDNFTLIELGFNEEGERVCKQLSDVKKKSYLIATPEARSLGEQLSDFYNGEGEYARIVILEEGYTRFDTSAFEGDPKNGSFAHFDTDKKKFVIHDGEDPTYADASAKFLVVSNEGDLDYTNGKTLCRFEVIEA